MDHVAAVWIYDWLFLGEKAMLFILDDDSTASTPLRSLLL
jgi:hypothetical protein